ncbi:MAG: right-handed parallel beta-helix repeat-containing protein [Candidatus Dormibacteraeota bacterium]|nr:right-handed parallel beta-helix repeat-containing protein [Candidatus Dormibacteraeota bacterium]
MERRTHYETLEVSESASLEVLRAAHRALVKRYHPDVGEEADPERMKLINEAWEVLSDPERRAAYDASLREPAVLAPIAPTREELTVEPWGATPVLGPALARARRGARIHLRPGTYRESLVIDREVELVGQGLSGGVLIEAAEGAAVQVQAAGVTLRNLTVHARGLGEDSHAVSIRGSRARLENCAVSSVSGTGILVTNGAQVIVHGCRVEQAGDNGIAFQGGIGHLEDCAVTSAGSHGVLVNGQVTMLACRVHDAGSVGVAFRGGARGLVEDCDVAGNGRLERALGSVQVAEGSDPVFRSCRIRVGQDVGVSVEGSRGTFDRCQISGHLGPAILLGEGADPTFRDCDVSDTGGEDEQQGIGIWVGRGARGLFERCRVHHNRSEGLHVEPTGDPTLRDCTIRASQIGVRAVGEALGRLLACTIAEASKACVTCESGADPALNACSLSDGTVGIGCFDSRGTFTACRISGMRDTGVQVSGGQSSPQFDDCQIHGNDQFGVVAMEGGGGTFAGCDIFGNRLSGVLIRSAATTSLRNCAIRQNREAGVFFNADGQGSVSSSNLTGNAMGPVVVRRSNPSGTGNRTDGVKIGHRGFTESWSDSPESSDDPYLSGLDHERLHTNVYFGELTAIAALVRDFARQRMAVWRQTQEEASPDGHRIRMTYSFQETREVRPVEAESPEGSDGRRGRTRAASEIVKIPYELECRIDLRMIRPLCVEVSARVAEHIDPGRTVEDYKLGTEYLAPSLLHSIGYFGTQLDPYLVGHLLPES